VSPVRCEQGFHNTEDDILHNHRSEDRRSYILLFVFRPSAAGYFSFIFPLVQICFGIIGRIKVYSWSYKATATVADNS
jgi:hypothetical protein